MSAIKDYRTVVELTFRELDSKVKSFIADGWQPFGSPFVTDGERSYVCQAMVSDKPMRTVYVNREIQDMNNEERGNVVEELLENSGRAH